MKTLLFVVIVVICLAYSCDTLVSKDKVRSFIPGTYIRLSSHEFGVEYDTVAITLQNPQAGEYRIIRRWKYERILNGKPVEPEYKIRVTTGVYNSLRRFLQERETGDQYSFDPTKQLLFIGSTKYEKL